MGGETEIPGEFFRFGKRCLCSPKPFLGELSSAGSERLPYKQRVGGSNPSAPTNERRRLRFLKRLFLFSGRGGRCGTRWTVRDGAGRCGSGRSRWTVRVEAVGAGRGGRCGSVWSVPAGSVGAGRVGTRRIGPGRPVRVGWCGTRRRAGLRVCHGGRPGALLRLSCASRLDVLGCHGGAPGAPLPLSCYRVRAAADSRLRPSSLAACCMLCSFRGSSIFGIARPSLSSTPLTFRALRRPRCGAGR